MPQATAQSRLRADFLRLIQRPRVPLSPQVDPPIRTERSVEERFTFAAERGERVPGIAVKPAAPGRRAAVIVLHSTDGSKEEMIPLLRVLADRRFLAVAIDARFHGERAKSSSAYVDAIAAAFTTGKAHPYLYDTVWDVMRLVDYLTTRPDVDPARIGLLGLSKGGIEAYLAAAVDPRIAVAVPVMGVQSFRWALEHDAWRPRVRTIQAAVDRAAASVRVGQIDEAFVRRFYDRVVPGIYGKFDGPAMLPLVAPRPLYVINADHDPLIPLEGVKEATAAAERAYRMANADQKFAVYVQPDRGHDFGPNARVNAIDWLIRWLKP